MVSKHECNEYCWSTELLLGLVREASRGALNSLTCILSGLGINSDVMSLDWR